MRKTRILIIFCSLIFSVNSIILPSNYFVSSTASGGGDGSSSNPWTIYEAAINAIAGDTVLIGLGEYQITSRLAFCNNGSELNPIVFIGEFIDDYYPKTVNGDSSSYLFSTFPYNGAILVSGDHVELHNLNIAQSPDLTKQLINVSGDFVTINECVIKYLRFSSGDHTTVIKPSAQNFKLLNSFMYYGGRTVIWGESDNQEGCDNIIIDGNTFIHNNNHNAIQLMPLTGSNPGYQIKGAIIRNNIFDHCTYGHNILIRHNNDLKIYNNIFLYSGQIKFESHNFGPDTTGGALIAYNTFIDSSTYPLYNQAMQRVIWKNNLVLAKPSLNNHIYRFLCTGTTPTMGHCFDNNLYFDDGDPNFNNATITWYINGNCSGNTTLTWAKWNTDYQQDNNSITGIRPQFFNESQNDFSPLNENSPQVGSGVPINDINTDFFGNERDPLHPTIGAIEYNSTTTGIKYINPTPNNFQLLQNYPNPFNPSTNIKFSIPETQYVTISVHNILGEKISELASQEFSQGEHTVVFDGSDLVSGVYIYSINTAEFVSSKKMILQK